jgi:hypothetical protein
MIEFSPLIIRGRLKRGIEILMIISTTLSTPPSKGVGIYRRH